MRASLLFQYSLLFIFPVDVTSRGSRLRASNNKNEQEDTIFQHTDNTRFIMSKATNYMSIPYMMEEKHPFVYQSGNNNTTTKNPNNNNSLLHPFHSRRHIQNKPPYSGTIFVSPDIIQEDSDISTYVGSSYKTKDEKRWIYDRRKNAWVYQYVYLFNAQYLDTCNSDTKDIDTTTKTTLTVVEYQVNQQDFSFWEAVEYVKKYGQIVGQIGCALRTSLKTVTINGGDQAFGGGSDDLLIHVDRGEMYSELGILGEVLAHELTHVSLDEDIYIHDLENWNKAVEDDRNAFISNYAESFPDTEDVAESFLLFYAIKYRMSSISRDDYQTIMDTIPNRIKFFESKSYDLSPMVKEEERPYDKNDDYYDYDYYRSSDDDKRL